MQCSFSQLVTSLQHHRSLTAARWPDSGRRPSMSLQGQFIKTYLLVPCSIQVYLPISLCNHNRPLRAFSTSSSSCKGDGLLQPHGQQERQQQQQQQQPPHIGVVSMLCAAKHALLACMPQVVHDAVRHAAKIILFATVIFLMHLLPKPKAASAARQRPAATATTAMHVVDPATTSTSSTTKLPASVTSVADFPSHTQASLSKAMQPQSSAAPALATAQAAAAPAATSPAIPPDLLRPAVAGAPEATAQMLQPPATAATPTYQEPHSQRLTAYEVFKLSRPAVVNITHTRSMQNFHTLDVHKIPNGQGSGFIWDARGHVVTAYHIIKGTAEVKVTLHDHSTYTAKVVGYDAIKDLAVLKLSMPKSKLKDLQPVLMGQAANLAIGHTVYGIGCPFGLDHTLTQGVVSGLGRELGSGLFPIKNVIQTTAASDHEVGGVLLDAQGQLAGIIAAAAGPPGQAAFSALGYAVPLDTIKGLVEQIIQFGRVIRPSLGITFAPAQVLEQRGMEGVLVLEVPPGSPAHAAGLRPTHRDIFGDIILGDVITGLDGRAVKDSQVLYTLLDNKRVGDRVKVDIIRDGKQTSLTVVLGERTVGAVEE